MADDDSDGPYTLRFAVIAVGVIVLLFAIFFLVRSNSPAATTQLPAVQHKGLQWAEAEITGAGFTKIDAYDALGRGRSWRDDKQWQVCFRYPTASTIRTQTRIRLAAVQTTEACPPADQGVFLPAGATMPDLTNRTAYMAAKTLGKNASVRFVQRKGGDVVTRGLGDWRVCSQFPKPKAAFDGVPVTAIVVPYRQTCASG